MAMFTRVLTVVLAVIQAVGIVYSFGSAGYLSAGDNNVFSLAMPVQLVGFLVGAVLVGGAVFTMWLGEKLTDLGIGNGISLIIFVGILSTAGLAIVENITQWGTDENAPWYLVIFLVLVIAIFGLITFIDGAERKSARAVR